jgi:hypothetical protein
MGSSLLIYSCIAVFIIYFILFSGTMNMLDGEERKRFMAVDSYFADRGAVLTYVLPVAIGPLGYRFHWVLEDRATESRLAIQVLTLSDITLDAQENLFYSA